MAKHDGERGETRRRSSQGLLRLIYGSALIALGTCLGIVIGSLSETPRLLLERLRGPVETVEVEAPAQPRATAAPELERFGELQEGKSPKRAKPSARPAPAELEIEPPPERIAPVEPAPAPPVAAARSTAPPPLPELASETPPAAAPAGSTVVQVASFVERKPADELVVKLKDRGFDAYVSQPAAQNGRFRVRIRPGASETAGELSTRLRGFGFDTWATSE